MFIGGSVKIWDTDFHSINPHIRTASIDNDIRTKPVFIDDYAFIGGGSIILKGAKIGKNSIISAGSVVTKEVPSNEIWGGNPAKFIKKIEI
ncbi:Maltose O-acetyltransferase [compost metagenome]